MGGKTTQNTGSFPAAEGAIDRLFEVFKLLLKKKRGGGSMCCPLIDSECISKLRFTLYGILLANVPENWLCFVSGAGTLPFFFYCSLWDDTRNSYPMGLGNLLDAQWQTPGNWLFDTIHYIHYSDGPKLSPWPKLSP